jgi:hypothetical protein
MRRLCCRDWGWLCDNCVLNGVGAGFHTAVLYNQLTVRHGGPRVCSFCTYGGCQHPYSVKVFALLPYCHLAAAFRCFRHAGDEAASAASSSWAAATHSSRCVVATPQGNMRACRQT